MKTKYKLTLLTAIIFFIFSLNAFAGPIFSGSPSATPLREIGASIIGRAVTHTLYVSENGSGTNGLTLRNAYTSPEIAFDAASTDVNNCTLIVININTGSNNYDINRPGDPTWSANLIIMGSHRTWAKIKNTHASATSIAKFTGYVSLIDLNFNLGTGSGNGVIITKGAFRVDRCQFVGQELTGAATALHADGATTLKHGKILDSHFLGHTIHMKAIILDNVARSVVNKGCQIHECLTGIQIVGAASDDNTINHMDIGGCAVAIDIDAGNCQHVHHVDFHGNTRNIDDEVGDHHYQLVHGEFPLILLPDNFTGVDLDTGAADTWGNDTEILSAASRDNPFRVIGIAVEADANEKFRVRLSNDSGATYFADIQLEGEVAAVNRQSIVLPAGTEEIFNKGARISGSAKSESGSNTATVWLQIQEI